MPPRKIGRDGQGKAQRQRRFAADGAHHPVAAIHIGQQQRHMWPTGKVRDGGHRRLRNHIRIQLTADRAQHFVQCGLAIRHAALYLKGAGIANGQRHLTGRRFHQAHVIGREMGQAAPVRQDQDTQ